MRRLAFTFFLMAPMALAQGALPWGLQAVSIPLLAARSGTEVFYVSSYTASGTHTDYDMARKAADAYLAANPATPTYLALGPAQTQTCDAVPLPAVSSGNGTSATVSVIGYGSNVSNIIKRVGCAAGSATLRIAESTNGPVTNALFQGFSVSANHIDSAACGFYGIATTTILDVTCSNAAPGGDHEIEFGNLDPNSMGRAYEISILNLKASDTVGVGKGAILTPQWTAGKLTSVTVTNGGTKQYTQPYARAQVIGPGLSSCTVVPTIALTVSNLGMVNYPTLATVHYGYVTAATVQNAGSCSNTAQLSILVQDGVPVTYGVKFTNTVLSHAWDVESSASSTYGEAWLAASSSNTTYGDHIFTNQTIDIAEYGANKHYNAFFDSPGAYGAAIYSRSGAFINPIFSWDSTSYLGSSGYYLGASANTYQTWTISNSQCTDSIPGFVAITTLQGPLSYADPAPAGVDLADVEACDGSHTVEWPTAVGPQ